MIRKGLFGTFGVFGILWGVASLYGASPQAMDGRELYEATCAACHGTDGQGAPEGTAITVPLPNLTDCSFNSREPSSDWEHVVVHGGSSLGLSDQMPAFEDTLNQGQIREVLAYIRTFCREKGWPRGEMNFRRSLFTTKAFPENEAVLTHEFTEGKKGEREWTTRLSFEQRIGARGQWEVILPYQVKESGEKTVAGPGDLALAYKHVFLAHNEWQAISAASLELALPSGDRNRGLGDGTVKFEPSLLSGIALGRLILQNQIQAVLPVDEDRAARQMRYRLAVSYPLSPLKRGLVPTIEMEFRHRVQGKSQEVFFLAPQLYTGIRLRGHVALAIGAQIPLTGADPFHYRLGAFLLWEYLDGGLWW